MTINAFEIILPSGAVEALSKSPEIALIRERRKSRLSLDRCIIQIEAVEEELAEVNVLLSYADQLYHLRMHVRFVKQRVEQARQETVS